MWRSLQDVDIGLVFEREFPSGKAPEALVRLLTDFSIQEYARRVFVFTSLGTLWLTTAPDFMQADQHDAIAVQCREDEYVTAYVVAGTREAGTATICKKDELRSVVERYLLRLLLRRSS